MIYDSFCGCLNWQPLWAPFPCLSVVQNKFLLQRSTAVLVAISIGIFFGTIYMHGRFQNSSRGNDLRHVLVDVSICSFLGTICMHGRFQNMFMWQWSMAVLVDVSSGSFAGTICMHGRFYNRFTWHDLWQFWWLCVNGQFLWHHLHAWQIP